MLSVALSDAGIYGNASAAVYTHAMLMRMLLGLAASVAMQPRALLRFSTLDLHPIQGGTIP